MLTDVIFFLKIACLKKQDESYFGKWQDCSILDVMANHMENSELIELGINILFDLSFWWCGCCYALN